MWKKSDGNVVAISCKSNSLVSASFVRLLLSSEILFVRLLWSEILFVRLLLSEILLSWRADRFVNHIDISSISTLWIQIATGSILSFILSKSITKKKGQSSPGFDEVELPTPKASSPLHRVERKGCLSYCYSSEIVEPLSVSVFFQSFFFFALSSNSVVADFTFSSLGGR